MMGCLPGPNTNSDSLKFEYVRIRSCYTAMRRATKKQTRVITTTVLYARHITAGHIKQNLRYKQKPIYLVFRYFYQQYLVLFITMVYRNRGNSVFVRLFGAANQPTQSKKRGSLFLEPSGARGGRGTGGVGGA